MKREDLEKRVKEIDEALESKQQFITQFMADLNVLKGHRIEACHWLAQFDKEAVAAQLEPLHAVSDCVAVEDHCIDDHVQDQQPAVA